MLHSGAFLEIHDAGWDDTDAGNTHLTFCFWKVGSEPSLSLNSPQCQQLKACHILDDSKC